MRRIGIEHEFFLLRGNSSPSVKDISEFLNELLRFGFKVRSRYEDGLIKSVGKEIPERGYFSVKNDFCTHVLEVATPPSECFMELVSWLGDCLEAFKDSSRVTGLTALSAASLDTLPTGILIDTTHPRYGAFDRLPLSVGDKRFQYRFFTTLMCATQFHFECGDRDPYTEARMSYVFEFLVPYLFSNSGRVLGESAHCVRPLVWRDSLPKSYWLNCIPVPAPLTRQEVSKWSQDYASFIRDYSFAKVTDIGTIEFRGGCSQPDISRLSGLLKLRLLISKLVSENTRYLSELDRDEYFSVCQTGELSQRQIELLSTYRARLEDALGCDVPIRPYKGGRP